MKIRNILLILATILAIGCSCESTVYERVHVVGPGYECIGKITEEIVGRAEIQNLYCTSGEVYHRITNYRIIK